MKTMTPRLRAFLPLVLPVCLLCWSAWAGVELTMHKSVEVYLGDSAQISCQYKFTEGSSAPSFVMINWFVKSAGSSRVRLYYYYNNGEEGADLNTNYTSRIQVDQEGTRLTIQDIQLSDERDYLCHVNGLEAGTAEGKTHLGVFAPPEAPVIRGIPEAVSVANEAPSKVASCEARNGFPKPNITWYRNGVPLTSTPLRVNVVEEVRKPGGFYSVQNTLEYKVMKEDKDSLFSCEVSFLVPGAIRTAESASINVTVHYPPTMVELWKDSPHGLVKEGDTVELRCQGDGNPPPTFIFNRGQERDADLGTSSDVLILPAVSRKDGGIYQCRPVDSASDSEVKGEMLLTVHFLDPAVVVPRDSEVMLRGETLIATCNASSSLKTLTSWFKDGKQVGQGNELHLRNATYDTTGEYRCEVTVPSLPTLHTSGSVHIIVQGGPQLVGVEQEVQLEVTVGRTVNLSCEVLGRPAPSISWSVVGSQGWREVVSRLTDHMTLSVVSLTVTSDISALCNASNDLGTEVKVFSIKAIPMVTSASAFSHVEGSGVIIVAIVLCLLLLAILGSVLYFLHKKGKIPCGRSGKQEITKERATREDIVVEMKTNAKTEDAILLKAVNGEKKVLNDQ
ncbi:cell surface glycoprotein MUC18 [Aulostomus maculatus]